MKFYEENILPILVILMFENLLHSDHRQLPDRVQYRSYHRSFAPQQLDLVNANPATQRIIFTQRIKLCTQS